VTITEYKPWRCGQCGTVLGVVERNTSRTPILFVLRHGVDSIHVRPLDESISCEIEGNGKVYCPACGHCRRWVAKEE